MSEATVSFEEFEVDQDAPRIIVRPMLTISQATDLFVGDLISRGYSERTVETYKRLLYKFCDGLPADLDVARVTPDDCRRFFARWNSSSAGTRAHVFSVLSSFWKWLDHIEKIKRSPMDRLTRPLRVPAEDLDVVSVTTDDVRKLLAAAEGFPERLAVNIAVCTGARRKAISQLRLRDYNRERKTILFKEKGGKVITKPVTDELAVVLEAAIVAGEIVEPDDYLVPARGTLVRKGERDDRVIWRLVKDVADRAGIPAHVHSLRAAFACYYLEENPGDLKTLKDLLGHKSILTTQVYLRKMDKDAGMERVRGLAWGGNIEADLSPQNAGIGLVASSVVGAGGFEPPCAEPSSTESPGRQRAGSP